MVTAHRKTTEEKIEAIKSNLEYLNDNALDFLINMLSLSTHPSKHDIIEMISKDKPTNYDTAYPEPYFQRLREMYPKIDKGNFIFDYTNQKFGELVNINDLLAAKIIEFAKTKYDL